MSGRSGVDDVQTQEEERAIVSKLATLLLYCVWISR